MLYGFGGPSLAAPPRRTYANDHPTEYAGTNADEGFAESFMLYCLRDPKLSAQSVTYFDALKARLAKTRADGWSTDSADD